MIGLFCARVPNVGKLHLFPGELEIACHPMRVPLRRNEAVSGGVGRVATRPVAAADTGGGVKAMRALRRACGFILACIALVASASPTVVTGTVDTPDGRIFYEMHGQGPAIVLVAGGPGSSRVSLRPEFDQLANDHTVIYFDNIGRGRSSDLPAGQHHSAQRDAQDIEHLRQALGFERIDLLGHSYGGYPALAYAGRHPERLRHLVISSSGHSSESWQRNNDNVNRFVENQYPEVWERLMALRRSGMRSCAPQYQEIFGEPVGQLYWHDPAKEAARPVVSKDPLDAFRPEVYCDLIGDDAEVTVGGSMAGFDARPALARVRVPTLITVGRFDPVCPPKVAFEIGAAFATGVAVVRIFENSSHRPWAEEGDAYFTQLRRFLRANEEPGAPR